MAHIEIVKNGRKLGEINDEQRTVEISQEWAAQPTVPATQTVETTVEEKDQNPHE